MNAYRGDGLESEVAFQVGHHEAGAFREIERASSAAGVRRRQAEQGVDSQPLHRPGQERDNEAPIRMQVLEQPGVVMGMESPVESKLEARQVHFHQPVEKRGFCGAVPGSSGLGGRVGRNKNLHARIVANGRGRFALDRRAALVYNSLTLNY